MIPLQIIARNIKPTMDHIVQGGGIEIKDLSLHTVMKHNILYNSFP